MAPAHRAGPARLALPAVAIACLALLGLGVLPSAEAEHPAEQVVLVVVDGPRHDLAFDEQGPLASLYEADGVTFANDSWTAGPAKSVPGHAALLTGRAQDIANDGDEAPEGPLVWQRLTETHGWNADEMRWLYQKPKLAVLATAATGGGQVTGADPDEAMLDALKANVSDPATRLAVASFANPDWLGHDGDWSAHRASLATIADGIAPLLAGAGEDTLVLVTADHARYCEEPQDHGRLGPFGPLDDCDAHVPLWAAGWHVEPGQRIQACLTQADVAVLVAEALDTSFPEAEGRFPAPLVDSDASWAPERCPPPRSGMLGVPTAGGAGTVAALALAGLAGLAAPRRP